MSTLVLAAALALAASFPVAALGLLGGAAADRFTRDPHLREAAWTAAFLLPLAALCAVVLLGLFPRTLGVSGEVVVLLPTGPSVAPLALTNVPAASAFDVLPFAAAAVVAALGGGLLQLARTVVGLRRLRALVRNAQPLGRAGLSLSIPSARVLVSREVDRPLLAGLGAPVILLPEAVAGADARDLALICAHEAAHASRGDNWRLLFESPVVGLFWFNPLVAAARTRLWAAREEVCDRIALETAPAPQRRRYAESLIDALRLCAGPGPQTAFTGARRNLAMRLQSILDPALPAGVRAKLLAGAAAFGLVLPLTGGVVLATAAVAAQGDLNARKSVHSYTSQVDRQPEISVRIGADDYEERPDGTAVSRGAVQMEVRNAPAGLIEVDGRPQPAEFSPATLTGRIAAVESRGGGEDDSTPVFNIVTQPAAPAPQSAAPPPSANLRPSGPTITRPEWIQRPSGEQLAAVYPRAARLAGTGGRATISCGVTAAGTMRNCTVVSEAPAGEGWGEAVLKLAPNFVMRAEGRSMENGVVRIPVLFQTTSPVATPSPAPVSQLTGPSPFQVTADRVERTATMDVWRGGVRLSGGDPSAADYPVRIDGSSAAAGFDPRGQTYERVEFARDPSGKILAMDLFTR